jgi:nicotinate-nucleotide--dimethylbenzimidazole phosphoribosyltransferase
MILEQTLRQIVEPDEPAQKKTLERLNSLTKPPGSLGKLEAIAVQIAGITGEMSPDLRKKAVVVMAADHGVCAEGVSAYPAEVTGQMVLNMLEGGAAVNVLARHAGADVVCVDVGVNADLSHPNLRARRIRNGTRNMAHGPALLREEAVQAIETGIEIVKELHAEGVRLFGTGDMGIGNTTASAAMLCAFTGCEPETAVGRGTGIDNEGLQRKREVVRRALAVNAPDPHDPIDVLAKVGGLEIAALAGVIIGAAAMRCPIVIDGFIASAAALAASRLSPHAASCMIASHLSQESGHPVMLKAIGLEPMLHMDMRLGEGTGAALAFPIIEAALKLLREMATFESAGISRKRKGD